MRITCPLAGLALVLLGSGCGHAAVVANPRSFTFPGARAPAPVDYLGFEPQRSRVWVPVPSTGSVDVLDLAHGTFARVDGFATTKGEADGHARVVGPNGAAAGEGAVYVGNRATRELCAIDATALVIARCVPVASEPDGVAYVGSAKEVWVTLPGSTELAVLDVKNPLVPRVAARVKLDGEPEGYATDEERGLFFTNLEDRGQTLAIDVHTREVRQRFDPRCNADGPRGIVFDRVHDFVIVACTDHLQVLDVAHDGALLGTLDTGAGVDNIDLARGRVYAAAGRAAKLTVAAIDARGHLRVLQTFPTSPGTRNVVADADGRAFVADSRQARILVFDVAP